MSACNSQDPCYNRGMKDNDNMVQCGLCQMNTPLSHMADDRVWGDLVCQPCMDTVNDPTFDPYKNDDKDSK